MTIRVTEDEGEQGGYALIDLGRSAPSPLLSLRRQDAEPRHLGTDGWQPEVAWLAPLALIEREGRAVARFGPNVVDRIEELVPIEIVAQDGTSFGVVAWPFITPAPAGQSILAQTPSSGPTLTDIGQRATPIASAPVEAVPTEAVAEPIVEPEAGARQAAEEAESSTYFPPMRAERPRRRLWPLMAMLVLILALIAAGTAYLVPEVLGDLKTRVEAWMRPPAPAGPVLTLAQNDPPPAPAAPPNETPAPPPVPEPPRPSAAELRQRYARLIDERAAPNAFLALGDAALNAQHGTTAFRAFEEADPVTNADAAWQLARFYDPGNQEPPYREAARPNPVRAAYYYALWRNRSPRHTDALRTLCETNAELLAANDRLRTICRP